MAADLHRGDLLISSLLLNQDDIINNYDGDSSFSNSSGSSSGVSSPFSRSEGTPNSSIDEDEGENEDEDEEYLAELSRRMAHFMLQEDEDKRTRTRSAVPTMPHQKPHASDWTWAWNSDVSPRTQSSSSVWGAPLGQSHGCQNWDVPCDVADKFEKMELNMDKKVAQHRHHYREPKLAFSHQNNLYSHNFVQSFSDDEVRAHVMKHQMQSASISRNKPKSSYVEQGGNCPPRASATAPRGAALQWQQQLQLQQTPPQVGLGMRAVFLGGSAPMNGSCGTGVFLPYGTGNSSEPRKKSRCSTVLIPARVAHALMLHFSKMGGQSISNGGAPPNNFPTQQRDAPLDGRKGQFFQQKGQITAAQSLNHNDLGLPQEWMY